MKYRVHRFDIKMTTDQNKLEIFLNGLEGEVVAIIPNVAPVPVTLHPKVDFLFIVEKSVEHIPASFEQRTAVKDFA